MITLFPIEKPMFTCITSVNISHSGEISCNYAVGTKDGDAFTPVATQNCYINPSEAAPLLNQQPTEQELKGSINLILYTRVYQFLKNRGDIKV